MPEVPVFVKIDAYKDVLDVMGLVKGKLQEARNILNKLNDLKRQEDANLDAWRTALDGVEKRIERIDEALFQPEEM